MTRLGVPLRILSCGIVALITLELCARVDDHVSYGAPLWGSYNINQIYEFDSFGRRGKPNAQFRKWKLNSLGYRGPELRSGCTRIAVLGASETFGLYEAPGHEFPRLLEDDLNQKAGQHCVDVVNAAYAGMPIKAMIARVPELSMRLKPEFALIYPSPANYIWLPWLRPEKAPAATQFDIRIKEQFRTIGKQMVPQAIQNWLRARQIEREAPGYGAVMDRVPEENVKQFKEDLQKLSAALRSHGIEPILVTHAHRFSNPLTPEDHDMLTTWRKFYPMLSEGGFLDMENRMNNVVRSLGATERYTIIDAGRRIPPGPKYFADFTHFTDEGSMLMAKVLAKDLYPLVENCCASQPQVASNPQP